MIQSAANLAAGRGIGRHIEFPHKLPLFREYLDPVLSTLADVDEAFFRELGEMQIWDEVLFSGGGAPVHLYPGIGSFVISLNGIP